MTVQEKLNAIEVLSRVTNSPNLEVSTLAKTTLIKLISSLKVR